MGSLDDYCLSLGRPPCEVAQTYQVSHNECLPFQKEREERGKKTYLVLCHSNELIPATHAECKNNVCPAEVGEISVEICGYQSRACYQFHAYCVSPTHHSLSWCPDHESAGQLLLLAGPSYAMIAEVDGEFSCLEHTGKRMVKETEEQDPPWFILWII
jgi:hypothetical protein